MPNVWQSEFERCKRRFEDLAGRYQPVTAVVIQIMQEPAPHVIRDVFGLSGPAGSQLLYAAGAINGKSRHLHLFGHDRAARDPLIAAAAEAWSASVGAGVGAAKSIEPPYAHGAINSHLWVHLLFEMLWSSQLPGRAPLEKHIDVELDDQCYLVPLDERYEPISGPADNESWNRAIELVPRPANWFHSQIYDLAGVSAAALDWMLAMGASSVDGRLSTLQGAAADGHFSPAELADKYRVDAEATRKALDRWRNKHAGGDGYAENPDRRPNEPQFLYSPKAVAPVMEALQYRAAQRAIRRTKTSGQRPAQ